MNAIFYNDSILIGYDCSDNWDERVTYLLDLSRRYSDNKHILYRLAAEAWYALTFWDCHMPKEKLNRAMFEDALKTSYDIARLQWWNDDDCLWLFGYFMSINQLDFSFIDNDFRIIEQEGTNLICQATHLNPDNQIAKVLYFSECGSKHRYFKELKALRSTIGNYFTNQSEIDRYFIELFHNMR